jgi:molybdopterin/thiamine biosynthesis adenylyltransferase/nitroreductase
MDNLLEALLHASAPDRDSYRPLFFRPSDPNDRAGLEALLKTRPQLVVHDVLENQLAELVRCTHPDRRFTSDALKAAVNDHLKGQALHDYGVWVYYPWSSALVHLLDENEFVRVRTDRNRNKITAEEQALLATKKVGVIGLSVGQSVCLTLALERSVGELRIADFDTLDLSNLNRIRSGVHSLGQAKTVNVAREIAEIDPFLKVTVFPEGVNEGNLERFCMEGGKLDLLIDECDGVDVKILCRLKAKELRIPVLMDTSDRGMLDVERFDLEPDRPILHGLIDHLDPRDAAKAKTNEEKLPFVLPIAGMDTLSARMKASMLEIESSVATWPQLASSVVMGGGVASDTWRRVALDQFSSSGRWFIDPEAMVNDGDRKSSTPKRTRRIEGMTSATMEEIAGRVPIDQSVLPFEASQAIALVKAGIQAPSAGNMQPWKVMHRMGHLFLFHDEKLGGSGLDPGGLIPALDTGAFIENMALRAGELGLSLTIDNYPLGDDHRLVAVISRNPGAVRPDRLAAQIPFRCTNRKKGDGRPIDDVTMKELDDATRSIDGCRVHFITEKSDMLALAELIGDAERIRVLHPIGHHEVFQKEIRWSSEEVVRDQAGLDLATMELKLTEQVVFRMAKDATAIAMLSDWDGGKGFKKMTLENIASASALALVSTRSGSRHDLLNAGRAAERMWLAASACGLSVHPCSAPILLAHPIRNGHVGLFSKSRSESLLAAIDRLTEAFDLGTREPVFLVRLSYSPSPTARSLRRPLETVLTLIDQVD